MQSMFKVFFSYLFCLSLAFLSGCGNRDSSALVGKWISEEGKEGELELLKDGTAFVSLAGERSGERISGTWQVENGRLIFAYPLNSGMPNQTISMNYTTSGTTLTLADDNGESTTFERYNDTHKVRNSEQNKVQQRREETVAYVNMLTRAVKRYAMDIGQPPTAEQGFAALVSCLSGVPESKWGGPYISDRATSLDPWGNPYQYANPGRHGDGEFNIWSCGPDGIDGTEDDIGSWRLRDVVGTDARAETSPTPASALRTESRQTLHVEPLVPRVEPVPEVGADE